MRLFALSIFKMIILTVLCPVNKLLVNQDNFMTNCVYTGIANPIFHPQQSQQPQALQQQLLKSIQMITLKLSGSCLWLSTSYS